VLRASTLLWICGVRARRRESLAFSSRLSSWQSVDDILVDEDSWGVGTQCITESTPDGNGYLTYRVRLQSKITE
jgi:hypothetical protein